MKATARNPGLETNVTDTHSNDAGPGHFWLNNQIWGCWEVIIKTSTRLQDTATNALG
jgi:hypothetical protein